MEVLSVERPESNGHAHEAEPEWISGQEAAAIAGVSRVQTLAMYVYHGQLHPIEVDGEKRYRRDEVERLKGRVRLHPDRPEPGPDEMTAKAIARVLDVTVRSVNKWWQEGKLACHQVGTIQCSYRADVEALKASRSASTALVPVQAAPPVLIEPVDPLVAKLITYRQTGAEWVARKREYEDLVRRLNDLGDEVTRLETQLREQRRDIDQDLDGVVGGVA